MAVLILTAASTLGGCNAQTPAEDLRANGDRAMRLGLYQDAADNYGALAARYPGDWDAQHKLGLVMLELDQPREARRALEVAHTRRPDDPNIADALAESLFRIDDQRQLFAFLNNRAETTQGTRAYLRLADYSRRVGDPDAARVAVHTAIELDDGTSVQPYLVAAALAEEVGDVDRAIHRLRQAYGIDPRNGTVRERLVLLGEVPGPTIALPPGR